MKNILIIILTVNFCFAQKNDNVWMMGYHYCPACPVPGLDFTYGVPDTTGFYTTLEFMNGTSTGICDNNGVLKLYTNGLDVINRNKHIVPGSEDFNIDSLTINYSYFIYSQCAVIVEHPGQTGIYDIFHLWINFNGSSISINRLDRSEIDISMNSGEGQMTIKGQHVIYDVLMHSTLQVIKHGNGRDWWIVVYNISKSAFYSLLFTPNGIEDSVVSATPKPFSENYIGQSAVSPNGENYFLTDRDSNRVFIYSFNRCSGVFSLNTKITRPYAGTNNGMLGCSVSPSNRYLYASDPLRVFQYDLQSANILASEIMIDTVDGYSNPFPLSFSNHVNGPDNKIYIGTGNASQYLHVINNPDQPGTNCNFGQHQQKLMYYQSWVPSFPHYRTGPLANSICDTILNLVHTLNTSEFNVKPNPSTDIFLFDTADKTIIEIFNIQGDLLIRTKDRLIDLSSYPAGIYLYKAYDDKREFRGNSSSCNFNFTPDKR